MKTFKKIILIIISIPFIILGILLGFVMLPLLFIVLPTVILLDWLHDDINPWREYLTCSLEFVCTVLTFVFADFFNIDLFD